MEIGWTDVGSGVYILVSCAHSNTSFHFISDLPASFMSEVQDFIKDLYNSGQIEMAKKHGYHRDLNKEFNPYELTISSSAACVDILFWAVRDESGNFLYIVPVWEMTALQLAKGEWKFRVANKIHFILDGLASNSFKASRNLKTLATITGYSFKIS